MKLYLDKIYFNKPLSFQSNVVGIILILTGIIYFYRPTSLNLKIGVASILIGLFMIFMMTGKTTTKRITDTQLTLAVISWIFLLFLITSIKNLSIEIFVILIFVGLLIIKEISSDFITTYIKDRMNIFIFLFLIIFILIVIKKLLDLAGM